MKREEKNQQTRRRIMDSALAEFSAQGYGASSINHVCTDDLSKGIIYHYFDTKDDLFLACVGECFDLLTGFIRTHMQPEQGTAEEQLERYFTARLVFFREHPVYQRIFCEAVVTPPAHLSDGIRRRKQAFDALNTEILEQLLSSVPLRPDITKAEAAEVFRQFQDFVNAHHSGDLQGAGFEAREQECRRILNILLYGVTQRKE